MAPAFDGRPQRIRLFMRVGDKQLIDDEDGDGGGGADGQQRHGETHEADPVDPHGDQFVVLAEVGEAEQQSEQEGHGHDDHEHLGKQNEIIVNDSADAGVVLDELVQCPEQIDDDHQHREDVEAIQQRPGVFAQQIFVENPHTTESRERTAMPREKRAGRDEGRNTGARIQKTEGKR